MNKQTTLLSSEEPWEPITASLNNVEDVAKVVTQLINRSKNRKVPHPSKIAHSGDWYGYLQAFFVNSMVVRSGKTLKLRKNAADTMKAHGITVKAHHVGCTFIDFEKDGWLVRFFYDGQLVDLTV